MFAYCNNNPVMYNDPNGNCYKGDAYFTLASSLSSFEVGDTCYYCGKVIDQVYFEHSYEWSNLAFAHPELSGSQISEILSTGTYSEGKGVAAIGFTAHAGYISWQVSIVIDDDECDIQNTIGISSSLSFGFSADLTYSSARDVQDMKGWTVIGSATVPVHPIISVQNASGIMPSGYLTQSFSMNLGSTDIITTDVSLTWTW